jgi:hypothetical protein
MKYLSIAIDEGLRRRMRQKALDLDITLTKAVDLACRMWLNEPMPSEEVTPPAPSVSGMPPVEDEVLFR